MAVFEPAARASVVLSTNIPTIIINVFICLFLLNSSDEKFLEFVPDYLFSLITLYLPNLP